MIVNGRNLKERGANWSISRPSCFSVYLLRFGGEGCTYSKVESNLRVLLFHVAVKAGFLIGNEFVGQCRGQR